MAKSPTALHEFVARYGPAAGEEGPVLMVEEVLDVDLDPWQKRLLRAFGRGDRQIAVRSCHGPGKTAGAAWCSVYMLLCRFPQKTVVTAPTSGQLKGALVPEIKKWIKRLPPLLQDLFTIKAEGIYLTSAPEESFLEARTSRAESPEALQGVHAEHVLLVGDEASGIPEQVYEAAIGSMSSANATTLLIGNPVRTSGFFFDCFHRLQDQWTTLHVSHGDSPRVTEAFVDEVARRYGRDSNAFRIRCLGKFPKSDQDTVIPFEWVESARQRDVMERNDAARVWGLDVARFGDDRCALVDRTNRSARVLDVWDSTDLMATAGRVKSRWDDAGQHERPRTILVDSIGMGGGVVDRLRELGLPVRGVNVSETSAVSDKFMRARSELWWQAREWLEQQDVRLEPGSDDREDPQDILASELVMPKYQFTSTGKIKVEPKDDTKKRARKSPDVADAFVLTFAEDLSILVNGNRDSSNWNEPLKRNIAVV